jgi:parallel beta-helix repeat protein
MFAAWLARVSVVLVLGFGLLARAGTWPLQIDSGYRFHGDLLCHANPCVVISGSGFTVDGAHHVIDCNGVNECVVIASATGVMVMNLEIRRSGAYGLEIEGGREVTLAGLSVIDHPVAAIALHDTSSDALTRVNVRQSGAGIELRRARRVSISAATASGNVWGIAVDDGSAENRIEDSTITRSARDGIVLRESTRATRVHDNELTANGNGIDVFGSDNTVSNNTASRSEGFGIVVSGAGNLVSDNLSGSNGSFDVLDLGPGCARWNGNAFDSSGSACIR